MKKLFVGLLTTAAIGSLSVAADAAEFFNNLHPAFIDVGISLQARRLIVGLAPTPGVLVTLRADANVVAICTNNGGKSRPAVGAEPISVAGVQFIGRRFIVNGTTLMNVVTFPPQIDVEGAPDCKANETETIVDLRFTGAKVTVEQPVGTVVLTTTCTIAPPTVNGGVPYANATCS